MVKDPYRKIAKVYDSLVDPMNAPLRNIARRMHPPTEGKSVLDVGCGTGTTLDMYERAGCEVFGVDLSLSMLEKARMRLGERAHLRHADATEMPFEDDRFDLVVTMFTLHEMSLETRNKVIDEMTRVVNPSGRMLLIDFHGGPYRFPKGWFFKIVFYAMEIGAGREHFRNYRGFMSLQGLNGLIDSRPLTVEESKIVSGGNVALLTLRT